MVKHRKKKEPNRSPRIGASYRAGTTAVVALAPVTDEVINSIQSRSFSTLPANLKSKALTVASGGNLLITTADAALDSKMGHSGALSRGSLTAWFAEGVRLGKAATNAGVSIGGSGQVSARGLNAGFSKATTGYDAQSGQLNLPDALPYQAAKRGGQILRRVSNRPFGKRVLDPVKKGLKTLGLTL